MRLDPRSSNDKRSLFERLVEFLSPDRTRAPT